MRAENDDIQSMFDIGLIDIHESRQTLAAN
jgi:hypothetical protein